MSKLKGNFLPLLVILLFSLIFVSDLFISPGLPTTFDNPFHTTNVTQFFISLKSGDFPVRWSDGIGNYGLPIPIVAHQLTSYLGAFLLFLNITPEFSLKLLYFFGVFFSGVTSYYFMRLYFTKLHSLVGTFVLTFSSYRIFDVYVRGALPEVFSGIFLPLILTGSFLFLKRSRVLGLYIVMFSVFLLALNHPMMLFIYSFIFVPYIIWLLLSGKKITFSSIIRELLNKKSILLFFASIIGLLASAYYLIPLTREIKYFYFGLLTQPFNSNSFLSFNNLFSYLWPYFTDKEIATRGHIVQVGLVESFSLIVGIAIVLWQTLKRKKNLFSSLLIFAVADGIFLLFIMSPFVAPIFENNKFLGNIQFQWRILSAFIFLPAILTACILSKYQKFFVTIIFVSIMSLLSFSQIYGKNFRALDQSIYYFTPYNVHSVMMNTIWTGKTEEYSIEKKKIAIIEGKGEIVDSTVANAKRLYKINATTPVRLVDYTFYFPGWKVTSDKDPIDIEFQDPSYRGVITYRLPEGKHDVEVRFTETKIRLLSDILSIIGFMCMGLTLMFRRKIAKFIL